jgi:uncharacterized protein
MSFTAHDSLSTTHHPMKKILLSLTLLSCLAFAAADDPQTIAATGQKFTEPKATGHLRVLVVGSGSSHNFPKFFLGTDSETLKATGSIDTAATPNPDEALALMPQADVLVFSGNHPLYGKPEFQKALTDFAAAGKGIVFLHAATWKHPWKTYNETFICGETPGHGKGEFLVTVKNTEHPVMKGIPATFSIIDENYHTTLFPEANVVILAENAPEKDKAHPSVWIVNHPSTRIVCITLGHAAEAHGNPAYKSLLTNAVNWVSKR